MANGDSWGTQTRQGHTCFTGLTSRRKARLLRDEWNGLFPDYAPYAITKNGSIYHDGS